MLNDLLRQSRAGAGFVLALLLCSVSVDVAAQTTSCGRPSVYFVNGILNSPSGARESADEIGAAINARFPEYGVRVQTIYNPSEYPTGDVAEVALQQYWLQAGLNFVNAIFRAWAPLYSGIIQSQLDRPQAAIRERTVINEIKRTVLADIRSNAAPVVLIAHSQGNILVNEAVFELQTEDLTREIPGIKTIAVLGIGVASRRNLGQLIYHGDLYRYITSTNDVIINPLQGVPASNFRPSFDGGTLDPLNHLLGPTYLSLNSIGYYEGSATPRSTLQITIDLFGELYQNASRAWPCLSLAINPSPAIVQQNVVFTVSARDRLSGHQIPGAQVRLTANEPNQSAVICSQPTDQSGIAVCNYRFLSPPRTVTILLRNVPSPTLPPFESAPYPLTISDGTFEFQVTNNPNGTFSEPVPSCTRVTRYIGDGIIELNDCYVSKGSRIRCVGTGCVQGRFWVSVTATLLSQTSDCGFPPNAYCQSRTDTQVNYGVDQGFTGVYVPGSPYHFELRDGNWQKGWPSCSPLSPLNGACEPYDRYSANFTVVQPKSDIFGFGGWMVGGTLDLTYSIFDTWTGTTYTRQNRVTVP